MEQPPGYVAQGEIKVCHLKNAIYDLKQSLRACLRSSVSPSLALIFTCILDYSVFVQHTKAGTVILAAYVDDILLTNSD